MIGRNLVRLQGEDRLLDGRIAHVMANRLDQAADARAVDVMRILHRHAGEIVGDARPTGDEACSASRASATTISRAFTASPNCASYAS